MDEDRRAGLLSGIELDAIEVGGLRRRRGSAGQSDSQDQDDDPKETHSHSPHGAMGSRLWIAGAIHSISCGRGFYEGQEYGSGRLSPAIGMAPQRW